MRWRSLNPPNWDPPLSNIESFATAPMWAGFIVFVMIFSYFAVPPELQRRVLL